MMRLPAQTHASRHGFLDSSSDQQKCIGILRVELHKGVIMGPARPIQFCMLLLFSSRADCWQIKSGWHIGLFVQTSGGLEHHGRLGCCVHEQALAIVFTQHSYLTLLSKASVDVGLSSRAVRALTYISGSSAVLDNFANFD